MGDRHVRGPRNGSELRAGLRDRAKDRSSEIMCGRDAVAPGAPGRALRFGEAQHEHPELNISCGHDENIAGSRHR